MFTIMRYSRFHEEWRKHMYSISKKSRLKLISGKLRPRREAMIVIKLQIDFIRRIQK